MDVQSIASAVALELGHGWTVQPGQWSDGSDAFLTGPDVRLHVHQGRALAQRERLAIAGALTSQQHDRHHSTTDGPVPEITVSPDKAARLIAGDIRRRLLPTVRPFLDILIEREERHQAAERARDRQVNAFAALIPDSRASRRTPARIEFGVHDNGGDICVLSRDVRFTLRFPAEKAAKLVEFLGALQRREDWRAEAEQLHAYGRTEFGDSWRPRDVDGM